MECVTRSTYLPTFVAMAALGFREEHEVMTKVGFIQPGQNYGGGSEEYFPRP